MKRGIFPMALLAAAILAASSLATRAFAETRVFIPHFALSDSENTQFLIMNPLDHDTAVDMWVFTRSGDLLGQFQIPVKAHGTRSLTIGDALQLKGVKVSGWIGAVFRDDGIQLSYTGSGPRAESFEAQQWISRETVLNVLDPARNVVRLSNPNSFAASMTITAIDQSGGYLGAQHISVPAFSQIELPAASVAGEHAAQLRVASDADVLGVVDVFSEGVMPPEPPRDSSGPEDLSIVIDSARGIGAYQLTLTFDPAAAQFSALDFEGGSADGFDSRPLVVNIDNASGRLTIASFQVGAHTNGRIEVARMRAPRGVRFGINVEEITDTAGNSLFGLFVGLVRTK